MLEFVLKNCDLGEYLLFDVLGHGRSVAANGSDPSAGDRRTCILIIRGGGRQGTGIREQPEIDRGIRRLR
jgi:hypothetical protein